jgi:DNA-binding NarL/FixJ family response regulator
MNPPVLCRVRRDIPRRELVTLRAYLETGSHKAAAHRLGISESTSRQRVSLLLARVGARNAAQAVWALRRELDAEIVRGRTPG